MTTDIVWAVVGGVLGIASGVGVLLCVWRKIDGVWLWKL